MLNDLFLRLVTLLLFFIYFPLALRWIMVV